MRVFSLLSWIISILRKTRMQRIGQLVASGSEVCFTMQASSDFQIQGKISSFVNILLGTFLLARPSYLWRFQDKLF